MDWKGRIYCSEASFEVFLEIPDCLFCSISSVAMRGYQLITHFFFYNIIFSATDASLSIVCSLGFKTFDVISSNTLPEFLTHSAPDLDLMKIGL
jgi:hypothetical protein